MHTPINWIVEKVTTNGRTIYQHTVHPTTALTPSVARAEIDILKAVLTDGTAKRAALANGRPAAAKTGAQDRNTDAWIVGGTPDLTIAVWMGNPTDPHDSMAAIPAFAAVGPVRGGTYPARVLKDFLDRALKDVPHADWQPPPTARPPVRLYLPSLECDHGGPPTRARDDVDLPNTDVTAELVLSVVEPSGQAGNHPAMSATRCEPDWVYRLTAPSAPTGTITRLAIV